MIGSSRMGNIRRRESWHVTLDTAIVLASYAANAGFEFAALTRMASLAALPVIIDFLRGTRVEMRIMAGDASQFVGTPLKAPAGMHLFDMANRFLLIVELGGLDINGNKRMQREAGTIIRKRPISFLDAEFSLQMTLLAHLFAPHRVQVERVDDRVIQTINFRKAFPFPNVDLSWTMAALAADRIALEDR